LRIRTSGTLLPPALGLATVAALLLAAVGCSLAPGGGAGSDSGSGSPSLPIAADVVILEDPVGGYGASDLACTFEATQVGAEGTAPIQIRVDWSAPCGTHKTETFTFRGPDQVFTTTYQDPAGLPLSMTFWASITWVDPRGRHVVRSASAAPTP